jgi:hypothetical protein
MIQAKSQDTLSEFQTDFWKCLEWQRSCWTHCYYKGGNTRQKVYVVVMEKQIWSGNYLIAPCTSDHLYFSNVHIPPTLLLSTLKMCATILYLGALCIHDSIVTSSTKYKIQVWKNSFK